MHSAEIIKKTEEYVRQTLEGEGTGHDWYHIDLVRKNALKIARVEGGDVFIIELAALLHDIADHKLHNGDYEVGPKKTRIWLESLEVAAETINHITDIVSTVSFSKKAGPMKTLEGEIVQDADRLEALGAIGIARCFATGAKLERSIYDPNNPRGQHSIQHFYDKLLKLKDLMNTESGKKLAEDRHKYLEAFLEQFYAEWEGKR